MLRCLVRIEEQLDSRGFGGRSQAGDGVADVPRRAVRDDGGAFNRRHRRSSGRARRELGMLVVDEMEDELMVSLRAWQSRVYDAGGQPTPFQRRLRDLAHDAPLHLRVPHHALRDVCSAGLELRLHEHERLPAGSGEPQYRRQRETDGDERDVADHELRRERQRVQETSVRPLEHDHPRIVSQAGVQLAVADVESDHPGGAALEQDVGEAAGRGADVEAVEPARIDARTRRARSRACARPERRTAAAPSRRAAQPRRPARLPSCAPERAPP